MIGNNEIKAADIKNQTCHFCNMININDFNPKNAEVDKK